MKKVAFIGIETSIYSDGSGSKLEKVTDFNFSSVESITFNNLSLYFIGILHPKLSKRFFNNCDCFQ